MIDIGMLSLLCSENRFSFYHNGNYLIAIEGKLIDNTWVINIKAEILPHFAFGLNGYKTKYSDKHNVIRYFIMLILNRLTDYDNVDNAELINLLKTI